MPDGTAELTGGLVDVRDPFKAFAEGFLPLRPLVMGARRSLGLVLEMSERASSTTTRLRAGGIVQRAESEHKSKRTDPSNKKHKNPD